MKAEKIQLEVARLQRLTRDSVQLFLRPLDGREVPYEAGQFLTFIFPRLGPAEIRRSYSLSSTPGVDQELSVCVKRTVNGTASAYLTGKLEPGDRLTALPAAGQFTLPPSDGRARDILLVGGGSGITPLFSLLKKSLTEQPQDRLLLILANRSEGHIIFRKELIDWQNRYPERLKVIHWLSMPNGRANLGRAEVRPGRLSNITFEDLVKQEVHHGLERAHAYLCGPEGLMLKAEMTLRFLGFTEERVHREDFIISRAFRPKPEALPDCRARLVWKDEQREFLVPAGQSVLEAALAAGIELPYSCRSGSCTSCSAQLLSGRVEMYTSSSRVDSRATRGHIFTCVAYPQTEGIELELT